MNGAVAAAVDEVVEAARKLVLDVSEGLTYYDTYDRAFLQVPNPRSPILVQLCHSAHALSRVRTPQSLDSSVEA